MLKAGRAKKIMKAGTGLALGGVISAAFAIAGEAPETMLSRIVDLAEMIEQREEIDRSSILAMDSSLSAACKAHAIRYSGGSHDEALAKVDMVLGVREIEDLNSAQRDMFGEQYLEGGCPPGLLLQLIGRHHEMERFVNEGLLALQHEAAL